MCACNYDSQKKQSVTFCNNSILRHRDIAHMSSLFVSVFLSAETATMCTSNSNIGLPSSRRPFSTIPAPSPQTVPWMITDCLPVLTIMVSSWIVQWIKNRFKVLRWITVHAFFAQHFRPLRVSTTWKVSVIHMSKSPLPIQHSQ